MVQSILLGLQDQSDLSEWMIFSPSGTSAAKLAELVGARHITDLDQVGSIDFVLIGCKPQQLQSLKATIGDRFQGSVFVSLLAAVSEANQRSIIGEAPIIRCMPNLPVEFKKGVILLSSNSAGEKLDFFRHFFSVLGTSMIVSEVVLEELTLLTGSGPALFYEFTQILSESFGSLDQADRERLARAVLIGAAKTVEKDQASLPFLKDKVTSKGGVTIAVLEAWRSSGFADIIRKGIEHGKLRSKEIRDLIRN
jgi:pyrroline-5-carboxylate reductase